MTEDADRLNKAGTKAKCHYCGAWYGLDDYHGDLSPEHLGWRLAQAIKALGADAARDADGYVRAVEHEAARKIARIVDELTDGREQA